MDHTTAAQTVSDMITSYKTIGLFIVLEHSFFKSDVFNLCFYMFTNILCSFVT